MKEKLEAGFLLTPKDVLTLTRINGKPFGFAEKAVYSYLLQWSKTSDKVFPSMKKMCTDLGVGSRTSMSKYLEKLEVVGLLKIEKFKGKSSHYKVLSLEGKDLSLPKESSLVSGTNETRRIEPVIPVVTPVIDKTYHIPEPTSPWDFEDEWDNDQVPF